MASRVRVSRTTDVSESANTTMASPIVTFCGSDVAIVAYLRLTQKLSA